MASRTTNKVRNALTENMQYGNAYSSLDDIVGTYGDITSSPGMIGRLRAQQDYKAYMNNLDKRTDLSEDYKIIIVLLINIIIKI